MNCAMLFSMIGWISIVIFAANLGGNISFSDFQKRCISFIVYAYKSIPKASWFPFFIKKKKYFGRIIFLLGLL